MMLTGWVDETTTKTMQSLMDTWPLLTAFGFGSFDRHSEKSHEEQQAIYESRRAEMLSPHCLDEFERARRFLRLFPKLKTINDRGTSYGLKHAAAPTIGYTSNGMFIAAAIAEGFKFKRNDPNAMFNISSHAWRSFPEGTRSRIMHGPTPYQTDTTALKSAICAAGYRVYDH